MKNRFKIMITSFSLIFTLAFVLFLGYAATNAKLNIDGNLSYEYEATYQVEAKISTVIKTSIPNYTTGGTINDVVIAGTQNELVAGAINIPNLAFPSDNIYKGDTITITFTIENSKQGKNAENTFQYIWSKINS